MALGTTGAHSSASSGPPYAREIEALTTLDPKNPRTLRRQALEVLCDAVEADTAVFWRAVEARGTHIFASPLAARPSAALEAALLSAEGKPRCRMPTLDLEHPRPVETRQFVALEAHIRWVGEEAFYASEGYQRFYGPGRVHSDLRLLVYGGGRFVGWIGAMRAAGSRRFEQKDRRRSSYLVPALKAALTSAAHFEDAHVPLGQLSVIAAPDGTVQHASREAEWLVATDDFRARLAAHVSAFDRHPGTSPTFFIDRVECSMVRMDATGDVGYLVTMSRATAPAMRAAAALTVTQRKIAEHAVRGATTAEIAKAVGCGNETVRTHLRKIYLRLGVCSRLELASALHQDEELPVPASAEPVLFAS